MAGSLQKLPRKLWEHPDPTSTEMYQFMQAVNAKYGLNLQTFPELHAFSVQRRADFWGLLFDTAGFLFEGDYRRSHGGGGVVDESLPIDAVPRWFDGVRLNFAENMLYTRAGAGEVEGIVGGGGGDGMRSPATGARSTRGKEDGKVAVTLVREGALAPADAEQRRDAARVAGHRTVQVNPKLLFMDDAAVYNGKTVDLRAKMGEVVAGLRADCRAFVGAVAVPRFAEPLDVSQIGAGGASGVGVTPWASFLLLNDAAGAAAAHPPPFVRVDFADPFLICYSSGTTGTPKAIVHTVGGCLLNYYKEARLHEGLTPDAVTLQFTTVGWIMYVATVTVLVFGCRTILYDGSPFQPDRAALVRLAAAQRVTKLGLSPRWMLELARHGIAPRAVADLSALRVVTSTGMVLSPELQHWFYDTAFPPHVHLANVSGGTDIAGCFGICNPLMPVYVGGAQGFSLGVDVRLFDTTAAEEPAHDDDDGRTFATSVEVALGSPGELVAVQAFPNIPGFFWNDAGSGKVGMDPETGRMVLHRERPAAPPGSRYHDAYFARFRRVWAHGDFCVVQPATGQLEFLGRADGVLNPSGVRFGSAEIYAVLERHFADRIADALCVGQRRPGRDADEAVLLFLLLRPGTPPLDDALAAAVRAAIARDLSKRHVPKYVFPTPAIPTTVNMKKVELPVKRIVCGERIQPSGTLANPESLEYFYQFAEIEKVVEASLKPKAKL
ncbi:AMP-dependent synthetase/ligase [Niveomyces insectorum RCEF 264]|uniref:AMP-dependent synthetase/ligase n=1 Tax=Niveomyces insectorum RCEF 264 TaxID=1081102 RepID=A0A162JGR9_9HYPO|nr:AMP-dependent synthetase/ligase [Niveomyces insectorum RCEF 264]